MSVLWDGPDGKDEEDDPGMGTHRMVFQMQVGDLA